MNKTALKNFATWSRRKLIEQVRTKAFLYGIDEKNAVHIEEQFGQLLINGKTYPLSMKQSFTALQKQFEQKGYQQVIEEVAYTWFNRIIAIRYMEVHEFLPEKVNVLSSTVGRVDPDILFEYDTMDLAIDEEKVRELVNAGDTEAAFRILFVAQCNALNTILPFMFEKIQDYTELLLPDFLLDTESVIKTLVQNEDLTESFGEIEVIGWLYQYYIAEEKDRVFAQKSKYKKEEIPFATQLFTPKWIVQYMVQNSLGRYWTEAHREDEDLIDNWEYFIKHEEEDFHEKIAPYVNKELKVENIKLLDPAMGSGHILVYAFEVFYEIYEKCGYLDRDIPRLILENNLYGLDIDDRANQLASFAVVMKAASYSKRFLRSVEREGIALNLASIQETNHISDDVIAYIAQDDVGERYNQVKAFFDQYYNAKTYGSLINITEREISFIEERFEHIANNPVHDLFYGEQHEIAKEVLPALIHQTKIMRNEYDVVVMNPPYMGGSKMSKALNEYLLKYYPENKADLYAAFMKTNHYIKSFGLYGAVNQHNWMFLTRFKNLRKDILTNMFLDTMLHLGPRAFDDISGEVVQTTAFILRSYVLPKTKGTYHKLVELKNTTLKESEFKKRTSVYHIDQQEFFKIEGYPIAYWATDTVRDLFETENKLSDFGEACVGMQTSDNEKFLRYWFEVDFNKIGFNFTSANEAKESKRKWFPYNKGGTFRKWYGNNDYVVNYENDGEEVKLLAEELNKKSPGGRIKNQKYYFKEGITWSTLTSGSISMRYFKEGFIFDSKGSCVFLDDNKNIYFLLGYLNSKVANYLISFISPTLDYNPGQVSKLPTKIDQDIDWINELVKQNIEIYKEDWDESEFSWDFEVNRLVALKEKAKKMKDIIVLLKDNYDKKVSIVKSNEEEINRYFIDKFDLKELSPKVSNEDITLKIPIPLLEVKEFMSYFIGCLMGRYKLNSDIMNQDVIFTSQPVINFTDSLYFNTDIIQKLREFLAVAFSPDTVTENMEWIGEVLEMKNGEDAETRIRRYFMDEFFTDHCKMYQKRPIYWLVDSGKQKGLRTLIYMHRYTPSTMATIRFEHLQEIQAKYHQEIVDLENRLVNPNLSATDKKKLNAEKVSFEKKIDELRDFDKRLAVIAAEEIEIDLDDGVKVNYEKFYRGGKGVLAKIK